MYNLGERMKVYYEDRYRIRLTRRMPVIMRLDGKAFHNITRGCTRPFDERLRDCMCLAATAVLDEVQGSKCAYIQSDEINILITDYDKLTTDAWFDYNVQKMVSISAAVCSVAFSANFGKSAYFDSRVFNVPQDEVVNYFIWRQKDWVRNSLQMYARMYYSHKELRNVKASEIHEMLFKKNVNWADLPLQWKNGSLIRKGSGMSGWATSPAQIFTQNRELLEELFYNLDLDKEDA